jgi:hypothetical protein
MRAVPRGDRLLLDREGVAEPGDGVVETRSGRPRGDLEKFGDLHEGQPEVVMQDEDRPLFDGEPAIRPLQLVTVGDGIAAVRSRWPVDGQDPDGRCPLSSALRLVVAGVNDDAMDPGFETLGVTEFWDPAPGEDQGVLQSVLGKTRVAQDPVGDRIEDVADLVHQDGERLSIAPTGLLDEVSIHPSTSDCRLGGRGLPTMTGGDGSNVQRPTVALRRSRRTTSRQRPPASRPIRSWTPIRRKPARP